jgi:hypothetical protein
VTGFLSDLGRELGLSLGVGLRLLDPPCRAGGCPTNLLIERSGVRISDLPSEPQCCLTPGREADGDFLGIDPKGAPLTVFVHADDADRLACLYCYDLAVVWRDRWVVDADKGEASSHVEVLMDVLGIPPLVDTTVSGMSRPGVTAAG